jgi:hypothetical protein
MLKSINNVVMGKKTTKKSPMKDGVLDFLF